MASELERELYAMAEKVSALEEKHRQLLESMRLQRNALAAWEDTARDARDMVRAYEGGSVPVLRRKLLGLLDATNNPPWKVLASENKNQEESGGSEVSVIEEGYRRAVEDIKKVRDIVGEINPYDHGLENEEQLNRIKVILRAW